MSYPQGFVVRGFSLVHTTLKGRTTFLNGLSILEVVLKLGFYLTTRNPFSHLAYRRITRQLRFSFRILTLQEGIPCFLEQDNTLPVIPLSNH